MVFKTKSADCAEAVGFSFSTFASFLSAWFLFISSSLQDSHSDSALFIHLIRPEQGTSPATPITTDIVFVLHVVHISIFILHEVFIYTFHRAFQVYYDKKQKKIKSYTYFIYSILIRVGRMVISFATF